jgi:hypothetical protein
MARDWCSFDMINRQFPDTLALYENRNGEAKLLSFASAKVTAVSGFGNLGSAPFETCGDGQRDSDEHEN